MRAWLGLAFVVALGCGDDEDIVGGTDDGECSSAACQRHPLDASARDASLDAGPRWLDSSEPNPGAYVWFEPQDNASVQADAGLGLSVASFARTRSRQVQVAELASVLELVTWPDAGPVAARISFEPSAPEYARHVTLEPLLPLAEGSYALRLRPTPANVRPSYWGAEVLDGLATSRFFVGSRPTVLRVSACAKADGKTKLDVTFSEPLHGSAPRLEVYDGDARQSCGALLLREQFGEALCSFVPTAATLRVRFEGLEGATGLPLRTLDEGAPDFTFANEVQSDGCITYVPWR